MDVLITIEKHLGIEHWSKQHIERKYKSRNHRSHLLNRKAFCNTDCQAWIAEYNELECEATGRKISIPDEKGDMADLFRTEPTPSPLGSHLSGQYTCMMIEHDQRHQSRQMAVTIGLEKKLSSEMCCK